jgi:hypothetical protein
MVRDVTMQQWVSLRQWYDWHGKGWRKQLWLAWQNGNYGNIPTDIAADLQHLRNTKGPSWLARVKTSDLGE